MSLRATFLEWIDRCYKHCAPDGALTPDAKEFNYRWEFDLESSPEQLWPLVADTNRFNRDTGVPRFRWSRTAIEKRRRHLRLSAFGIRSNGKSSRLNGCGHIDLALFADIQRADE